MKTAHAGTLTAIVLALALTLAAPDANAVPNACEVCELGEEPPDTSDADTIDELTSIPARAAYWACKTAREIACDDAGVHASGSASGEKPCWTEPIIGNVILSAEKMAHTAPKVIACGQLHGCATTSAFLWIVLGAVALTLIVDAGRALLTNYGRWTDVFWRLVRLGIVLVIIGWAKIATPNVPDPARSIEPEGLGPVLWDWTGHAVATGAFIGRAVGLSVQKAADAAARAHSGGSATPMRTSARCSSIIADDEWSHGMGGSSAELQSMVGWSGVHRMADVYLSEAADMGAILSGVALTLIPDLQGTLGAYNDMVNGLVTGELGPMLEVLRIMFSVTLIGTAALVVLTVAFQVLESIIIAGITIALSPIIAAMWIWEQTRSATRQALGAILYATMSLGVLGITLEVAYIAVEKSVTLFTSMTLDPKYPQDKLVKVISNPASHGTEPGCGLRADLVSTDGADVVLKPRNMYEAYQVYLCIITAPGVEIDVTGTMTPEERGQWRNWRYYQSRRVTRTVTATRVHSHVIGWLPAFVILIGAGIIASAIVRYAAAGASELSGFRASPSQVAGQLVGAGKAIAGRAGGKIKGLMGGK